MHQPPGLEQQTSSFGPVWPFLEGVEIPYALIWMCLHTREENKGPVLRRDSFDIRETLALVLRELGKARAVISTWDSAVLTTHRYLFLAVRIFGPLSTVPSSRGVLYFEK